MIPRGEAAPPRALVRLEGVGWNADEGLPTARPILAGIDFEVRAHERVGLVGPSGSGKTTLALLVAGLLDPSAGRIFDEEHERGRDRSPPLSHVGLVFQEPESGFFEESVLADVSFGPRVAGIRETDAVHRAQESLRLVGLDPEKFASRSPETLSGGEARRAAIAGVLAFRPRLLVFDEPPTGLDAEGTERLASILESLHARGASTLIISHDLPFLLDRCDRIVGLDRGRIVWEGPVAELGRRVPEEWRDALPGGEMLAIARALQQQGWIGDDVPPNPEALATAWASAMSAKRN